MNVTYPTTLVLQALSVGHRHGFDVIDATGLPSGTVYPILRRLEENRLVRSRWERAEAARREGRPPRRDYALTAAGEAWLANARERYRGLEQGVAPAGREPARSRS